MKRSGIVITETLVLAILGLITAFYGGAVTEAETEGMITDSISYEVNASGGRICKEYYPKIIITD